MLNLALLVISFFPTKELDNKTHNVRTISGVDQDLVIGVSPPLHFFSYLIIGHTFFYWSENMIQVVKYIIKCGKLTLKTFLE